MPASLGIKAGSWFIEEKQLWIADKRASECQALSLPAGKFADPRIAFFFELDEREKLKDLHTCLLYTSRCV